MKVKAQEFLEDEKDYTGVEDEGKKKPTKDDVIDWFKDHPDPDDEEVHEWADKAGYSAEDLEGVIYSIVTDHVEMLDEDEDGLEKDIKEDLAEEEDLDEDDLDAFDLKF